MTPNYYFLGERHGTEEQQLEVAKGLQEISETDSKVAVVMEMISKDQVTLVDTFRQIRGNDFTEFEYAIGWNKRESGNQQYHRTR